MVLEVLVHVQGVEVFAVKAGQQHVHHDGDVNFLRCGEVAVGPLLVFDALLNVLVIQVKFAQLVVGAIAGVVAGQNGFERGFFAFGVLLVVLLFLRQIFLNLLDVGVALGRGREDAGDVERHKLGFGGLFVCLQLCKQLVVFNGVVDAGGGQHGVETAAGGGGVVFGQDGFDHGFLGQSLPGLGHVFAFGLEVVHMKTQHVGVFNGVGDGVGVQLFFKQVFGGFEAGLFVHDLRAAGVVFKDGGAGKAKQLCLGEKGFDGFVVVAKLRAVALVKNEDDALVLQGRELLFVGEAAVFFLLLVALAVVVQRQTQLLDGGDDDLVGVVVRQQAPHQGAGVGVFFNAAFLEAVEFFAGLAVQVFAVHHKEAFFNVWVVFEQGGRFERGERFAAARGVPDVAVAAVIENAVHDGFDGVHLIGPHHQQLLFAGHEHHVAADGFAQGALGQKGFGKVVKVADFLVGFVGKLVDRQKPFVLVEGEVTGVVVGEVIGVGAVADDEQLQKAQQRFGVAVARIVFVINDLLHGAARVDGQCLQFHLYARHPVDEDEHVVAVVAVVGVDAQLVNHLEGVFAPVLDVDQGVVERCAVVAGE